MRAHALPDRRLLAAIALCYAGLCSESSRNRSRGRPGSSARELDRQILADGGHASRNPRLLIELLFDLCRLARCMPAARSIPRASAPRHRPHAADAAPVPPRRRHLVALQRHGRDRRRPARDAAPTTTCAASRFTTSPFGYEAARSRQDCWSRMSAAPAGRPFGGSRGELPVLRVLERSAAHHREPRRPRSAARPCSSPPARRRLIRPARSETDPPAASWSARAGFDLPGRLASPPAGAGRAHRAVPGPCRAERTRSGPDPRREPRRLPGTARHVHQRRWRMSAEGQWLEGEDIFLRDGDEHEGAEAVIRFHLAADQAQPRPGRADR